MATKKDKVNITYDALWFKIFMDSGDTYFYGKEIFISSGLAGNADRFAQLLGNVGGYARFNDFSKDIDVVILSDRLLSRFNDGDKDEFIQLLEDSINASNTPYRKLKFTTETIVLEYLGDRAKGRTRQNLKDLKDKTTSDELKVKINNSIEVDQLMLDQIKSYKDSAKEPQQQNLF